MMNLGSLAAEGESSSSIRSGESGSLIEIEFQGGAS
jgi:hypothetical protein